MADITMPQLGETVTEGTITKWFKQVGDEVAEDEVLFEVSTDKVDSEVPSPAAGYVTEILVAEGETVDVGTKLAVIGDAPGDGAKSSESGEDDSAEDAAEEPQEDAAEEEPEPEEPEEKPAEEPAAEDDEPIAEETEAEPESKASKESKPPKEEPAEAKADAKPSGGGDGKLLSPVVRRLVAEHDLDVSQIQGTGAGGRITRNDVLAVVEAGGTKEKAPAAKAKEDKAAEPAAAPAGAGPASGTRPCRSATSASARPST